MARPRRSFPATLTHECQRLLGTQLGRREALRLQSLSLACVEGLSNEDIAKRTKLSINSVRAFHVRARRHGAAALLDRRRGGRFREHLNRESEAKVLAELLPKARAGGVVVVTEVKRALEAAAGRSYHLNSVYRLLARHDWRKIIPRRVHPRQDAEAVASFKKRGATSSPKPTKKRSKPVNRSVSSSKMKPVLVASATHAVAGRRSASGPSSPPSTSVNTSTSSRRSIPSPVRSPR